MMTHDEMIAVIQAHKDGKKLEFRDQRFTKFKEWVQCLEPHWNFKDCDYRIKPEPRILWVVMYLSGNPAGCFDTKDAAMIHAASIHVATIHEYKEVTE
jgi:hypothetical protein